MKSEHKPINEKSPKIFLSKDAKWFHEGVEITHKGIIRIFSRQIQKSADGKYFLQIGKEYANVEVEDTAWFVAAVSVIRNPGGHIKDYLLHLSDGTKEPLEPESLFLKQDKALYCKVKKGAENARFSRSAYHQIAMEFVFPENDESCLLPWKDERIPVRTGNEAIE